MKWLTISCIFILVLCCGCLSSDNSTSPSPQTLPITTQLKTSIITPKITANTTSSQPKFQPGDVITITAVEDQDFRKSLKELYNLDVGSRKLGYLIKNINTTSLAYDCNLVIYDSIKITNTPISWRTDWAFDDNFVNRTLIGRTNL